MKHLPFILILALIIPVVVVAGCTQSNYYNAGSGTGAAAGNAVFAIADAAADMGSVTSVAITVDSIQVSGASGWTTVSSTSQTYDLLQLRASGNQVVLTNATLQSGTYDQVRLHIANVVVTDSQGQHTAKLPSNDLKIVGQLVVDVNKTSAVTFDFIANESLHVTGNGMYIMAPVVHLTTKSDVDVDIRDDNTADIRNGRDVADEKVGMDINGNVGVGLRIPDGVNLTIDNSGVIGIELGHGSASYVVSTSTKAGVGTYIVDASGMTLYYFKADTQGTASASPVSACSSSCLTNWPVFYRSNINPSGLSPGDFSSFARADECMQSTYDGWPLYYYAGDHATGDTNGQGVGGVWYVVTASSNA